MALSPRESSLRRAARTRRRLKALSSGRPRLSVFRSAKNIYAQIIDDAGGVTLAHASSLEGAKDGLDFRPARAELAPQSPSVSAMTWLHFDRLLESTTLAPPAPCRSR